MSRLTSSLLTGIGVGAGLMYFFDPRLGRWRRKLVLDQCNHAVHAIADAADATCKDLRNRSYGMFARLRSPLVHHDNSDAVIVQRVRSKLGHFVSHPHAIEVKAHDGHVMLRGPILAHEVMPLLSAVKSVIGVRCVEPQLDVHETPNNISALQGGAKWTGAPQLE